MKVLFIAPLPPPISGHSIASEVFLNYILGKAKVEVINLNKEGQTRKTRFLNRFLEIFSILLDVIRNKSKSKKIYFTISESLFGNLKDLLIYVICYQHLSSMYIHLHGGSIKRLLFDKNRFLLKINKFFISKMAGVIVLGASHKEVFDGMIEEKKIFVVPNFAEDAMFVDEEEINNKFVLVEPLKIVFVSNLLEEKGYMELIDAFLNLDTSLQENIKVDFAGRFDSESDRKIFLSKLSQHRNLSYHGVVEGEVKEKLFKDAHVLCLPTSYLEGQPIAILEAYAAGLVVMSTISGGIIDIFKEGINGFFIEERSILAVENAIKIVMNNRDRLHSIAIENNKIARSNYRTEIYNKSLGGIILN